MGTLCLFVHYLSRLHRDIVNYTEIIYYMASYWSVNWFQSRYGLKEDMSHCIWFNKMYVIHVHLSGILHEPVPTSKVVGRAHGILP